MKTLWQDKFKAICTKWPDHDTQLKPTQQQTQPTPATPKIWNGCIKMLCSAWNTNMKLNVRIWGWSRQIYNIGASRNKIFKTMVTPIPPNI